MRMSAEDANPATQTASVMSKTAAVAPPGDVANGVDGFSTLSQPAVPALEENLQGKELLDALKKQVEFYFSRQNLQTDGFLVSQMNAQMCVPVSVIAQFHKIQQLTTDTSLIVESVKDSTICAVTPDGIKPTIKQERNTIILREIPSETSQDKIREIFTGEGIAPIKSIRSDVGDTWFVTMDSEEDALTTILALRSKDFQGKPIKARLKSENILRSFFPVPTASEVQPTAAAAAAAPYGLGGPAGGAGGIPGMPYGIPGMGSPLMNGQPSFGFPGPGARGLYGRGGMVMQGPGAMRYGAMHNSGMVQGGGGGGGGRGGGGMMQQQRGGAGGGGGMQMGGMGGIHGGHQGHAMGQPLGMGMNPKHAQQLQQAQNRQGSQQQQGGEGRGEKKGSLRDREAMQQGAAGGHGGDRAGMGNGGSGMGYHQSGGYGGQRGGPGDGRSGGGERSRKGDRGSNAAHGRGDGSGQGNRSGGGSGKTRSSPGRDMLSAANFPPLPGADAVVHSLGSRSMSATATGLGTAAETVPSTGAGGTEDVGDGSQVTPAAAAAAAAAAASTSNARGIGYQGSFIQYQQDEILKIVSTMSQADVSTVPGIRDMREHELVFDSEPNLGLVMRQRSVSIDDCREQLRKGRPVHREGVISGAVDYGSYMYGEGHEHGNVAAAAGTAGLPAPTYTSQGGPHRGGVSGEGHVYASSAGSSGGGEKRRGERARREKGEGRSGGSHGGTGSREEATGGAEGRGEDRASGRSGRGSGGGSKGASSSPSPAVTQQVSVAPEPMGAYAAALLKNPKPAPPAPQVTQQTSQQAQQAQPQPQQQQQQQQQQGSSKPSGSKALSGKSAGSSREKEKDRDRRGDGKKKDGNGSANNSGNQSVGSRGESAATPASAVGSHGSSGNGAAHDLPVGTGSPVSSSTGSVASSSGGVASKVRDATVEAGENQARDGVMPAGVQVPVTTAPPRPARGWEKPEVTQQKQQQQQQQTHQQQPQQHQQRPWSAGSSDLSRGSKANMTKQAFSGASGGQDDKKSSSSTSTTSASVSGDEAGGDASLSSSDASAAAGDGSTGSSGASESKSVDKAAITSKEASATSEGTEGVEKSNVSTSNAPAAEGSQDESLSGGAGQWGGKKSFLDVVKAPGNPVPVNKALPPPQTKRADSSSSIKSPNRGRPEGGGGGGGGGSVKSASSLGGSGRGIERDAKNRESSRLPNGRGNSGSGITGNRERSAWA